MGGGYKTGHAQPTSSRAVAAMPVDNGKGLNGPGADVLLGHSQLTRLPGFRFMFANHFRSYRTYSIKSARKVADFLTGAIHGTGINHVCASSVQLTICAERPSDMS